MPPGASTAMPTITTGSAAANLPSDIGIHPSGNGVDVLVEVEVPAGVERQLERTGSVFFPQLQSSGVDAVVVARPQDTDIGANAGPGSTVVAVEHLVVRAHRGGQHLGDLLVGEQLGVCAAKIGELGEQPGVADG